MKLRWPDFLWVLIFLNARWGWAASFRSLEITILPRSGGQVLVDVRGEIEEATLGAPLTIIRLTGLHQPELKYTEPSSWPWEITGDGITVRTRPARGRMTVSFQIEGRASGLIQVFSDLSSQRVRVFLPKNFSFDVPAIDEIQFNRWRMKVYEVPGQWPLSIPTSKKAPWIPFAFGGGILLLAAVGGIFFLRLRSKQTKQPAESPEAEEESVSPIEEMEEEKAEIPSSVEEPATEPPADREPEPLELSPPVQNEFLYPPQGPSILSDPFVQMGAIGLPTEGEEDEDGDQEEIEVPMQDSPELPGDLGEEPASPAGFDMASAPEDEDAPPVSVEEQLLKDASSPRSVEETLLEGERTVLSQEELLFSPEKGEADRPQDQPEQERAEMEPTPPPPSQVDKVIPDQAPKERDQKPSPPNTLESSPSPQLGEDQPAVEKPQPSRQSPMKPTEHTRRPSPDHPPTPGVISKPPLPQKPGEKETPQRQPSPSSQPERETPKSASPSKSTPPSSKSKPKKPLAPSQKAPSSPPQQPSQSKAKDREALIREWLEKRRKKRRGSS